MSRYKSQYRTKRLPKRSRTIPIYGSDVRGNGEDSGKYFRCWNCGFICDIDRDSLGGNSSLAGTDYIEADPAPEPSLNNQSLLGGIEDSVVSLKLTADGSTANVVYTFKSVITAGCPLCGTVNWYGKY